MTQKDTSARAMLDAPAANTEPTRAEELRSFYYYDGTWHTTNNLVIVCTRANLLASVELWEVKVEKAKSEASHLRKAFERAQAAYRDADEVRTRTERDLDIMKLALADEMGIPS